MNNISRKPKKWQQQKNITEDALNKIIKLIEEFYALNNLTRTKARDDINGWDLEDQGKNIRIGVRLRQVAYTEKYDYINEFTIRSKVKSGNKTEYNKIINDESNLNIFIYGFMSEDRQNIIKVTSINLEPTIAKEFITHNIFETKDNKGDGTKFHVFKIDEAVKLDIVDFIYENNKFSYEGKNCRTRLTKIIRSNITKRNKTPSLGRD